MRILALEPFYGGSHQAFLDDWILGSQHHWDLLTLPAHNWKWRMRHAAITFAETVRKKVEDGAEWDLVFCSDMLDLAGFTGLATPVIQSLPKVAYFHENQLTYPVRKHDERDYHFGLTNITTCLAADATWFNSAYHAKSFLDAVEQLIKKMTDHQPTHALPLARNKATVFPQGIDERFFKSSASPRKPGPLRVTWAARWEHDKNPEDFFAALTLLMQRDTSFRISVLGEQFREAPGIFNEAKEVFADRIDHWGYVPSRTDYLAVLQNSDVVVSTAQHEFFGVSLVEAVLAGAYPLAPLRLAYPEVLEKNQHPDCFYDGSAGDLARRLGELAKAVEHQPGALNTETLVASCRERFAWSNLRPRLDDALETLVSNKLRD
jgi:glycosyltransferase involved in cell wall biosynthesis